MRKPIEFNFANSEPGIIKPTVFTREQKLSHMIHECMRIRVEIPTQWIEEYNKEIKNNK